MSDSAKRGNDSTQSERGNENKMYIFHHAVRLVGRIQGDVLRQTVPNRNGDNQKPSANETKQFSITK